MTAAERAAEMYRMLRSCVALGKPYPSIAEFKARFRIQREQVLDGLSFLKDNGMIAFDATGSTVVITIVATGARLSGTMRKAP